MADVFDSQIAEIAVGTTTEPLPNVLGPAEMRRVFGLAESTFYLHQRAGKFKRFLLPRAIGVKRYSGRLVESYLNGAR